MSAQQTSSAGAPGKPPAKSPRRRAREFAMQGIYQRLLAGNDEAAIQGQAAGVAGFERADQVLYERLLRDTLAAQETLVGLLAPHIDRPWNDVSPVERSILLLAAAELHGHPETPFRVVINEAIELAKTYGGTDGHKFVNGVLDKLAPQLRAAETGVR